MATETDRIREEIENTRSNLSLHIASLEEEVMGTMNAAKDTVSGTIDSIKSGVEKFKPSYQLEHRPLLFLGGSVLVGLAAGAAFAGGSAKSERSFRTPAPVSNEMRMFKGLALTTLLQVGKEVAKSLFPKHESAVQEIFQGIHSKLETGTRV